LEDLIEIVIVENFKAWYIFAVAVVTTCFGLKGFVILVVAVQCQKTATAYKQQYTHNMQV